MQRKTVLRIAQFSLLLFVIPVGIQSLMHGGEALGPYLYYRKDSLQDYLMVRSVFDGENPYQPVNKLIKRYIPLPLDAAMVFPHASPHPPSVVTMLLPMGFFDYPTAALLWFLLSIAALAGSCWLTARIFFTERRVLPALAIFAFALSSSWMYFDLILGQFNTFLLLAVTGCIAALQAARPRLSGICLGFALSIKFFGIPLLALLLIRRQFKVIAWALGVFATMFAVFIALVGLDSVRLYFATILPQITLAYRPDEFNISMQSLGQRIFAGLYPSVQQTATVAPIFDAPSLARPAGVAITLLVSAFCFTCALRQKRLEYSLAYLAALTSIVSPVAWAHGLLLFVPLLVCGFVERKRLFPTQPLIVAAVIFVVVLWNSARLRNPLMGTQTLVPVWYHPLLAAPLLAAVAVLLLFGARLASRNLR